MPAATNARFHEPTAGLRLVVGRDQIVLAGNLDRIGVHRHASAAVVVGLDAPLTIVADRAHRTRAALIAPGFAHALEVRGRIAVFLLPATLLARSTLAPVRDAADPARWLELGHAGLRGELDELAAVARCVQRTASAAVRPVDDRVCAAIAAIADHLEDNLPVDTLADAARLSPSRLMALVRAELGTSLRGYRRWLRTFEVARRYARGASLTVAALDAGFASSAHLVTAARAQFGVRPSQILAPGNRGAILSHTAPGSSSRSRAGAPRRPR